MMEDQVTDGAVNQTEQQPLLPQDQVNKIVAREKAKAADAVRRELEDKHQRELESLNARRMQQEQSPASASKVDMDAIYQNIHERINKEAQKRQLEDHLNAAANTYLHKVSQGKSAYEDFDTVTKDFRPEAFPQITYLLSNMDNAADILYDLSKNPLKLAAINSFAQNANTVPIAQNELMKLSQSISANKQAQTDAQNQNVSDPLDRLQPSRVSGSNGKMSIRDLRNQPWLRG